MNLFSDTREAARRFGDYIEDLHDIFRCNRIDFGSPQDFVAFARTVKHQSDLRNDVMRVVRSLREDETNISFRTILTIIAVASGGPDVAMSSQEMSVPVQRVVESLNSTGPDKPHDTEPTDEPADLSDSSSSVLAAVETNSSGSPGLTTPSEEVTRHRDALEYVASEEPFTDGVAVYSSIESSSIDPVSINPSIDQGSLNNLSVSGTDSSDSNMLAESLSRLESNSLQLKTYLDSIEQRIARIEPRRENILSPILPVPPVHPVDESGTGYLATVFTESEPRQPHDSLSVSNQGGVATEPTEIFARPFGNAQPFSTSVRKGALPIFAGATTLVLAASLLWVMERGSGNEVKRPSSASVDGVRQDSLSGASLGVGDPSTSIKEPQQTGQVSDSANMPAEIPKRNSAKALFRSSPRPSLPHAVMAKTQPVASSETSENISSDGTDGLSSEPLERRPLDVSSDVMAANLVSDPQPSYPLLANLTHMQGSVVMQAVISRDGAVERLHVIKGHRLLRSAAKNAVQNWRYRPYKVDGVPVEVATVVSVDFSRHR
jgi:TonB family protein